MLKRSLCLNAVLASALVASMLAGCGTGSGGSESPVVTPQGTMELDRLKVGVPEQTLEKAVITFELDENPLSRVGGKSQYLSRTKDKYQGKYVIQCKDGNCFQIQSLYTDNPITKEQSLEIIKSLLPETAPEQSRVDDSEVKAGKSDNPSEKIYFGEDYLGELIYAGKDGGMVQMINVYDLPKFTKYIEILKADAESKAGGKTEDKTESEEGAKKE